MSTVDDSQIYRELLRFKPEDLSPNAWAVKAGVSRTVWADMRRHGNPSRRTLEKLLNAAGSSLAEFEALRLGPEPPRPTPAGATKLSERGWGWSTPPLAPIPLLASHPGGEWGEIGSRVQMTEIRPREMLDRVSRPESLANDSEAYAVTIVANTMWPRFRPGTRVAISPRSPVAIGDDVLVRLTGNGTESDTEATLIMHLVRRTATSLRLRQFNPDVTIEIGTSQVDAVLKIAGELI